MRWQPTPAPCKASSPWPTSSTVQDERISQKADHIAMEVDHLAEQLTAVGTVVADIQLLLPPMFEGMQSDHSSADGDADADDPMLRELPVP